MSDPVWDCVLDTDTVDDWVALWVRVRAVVGLAVLEVVPEWEWVSVPEMVGVGEEADPEGEVEMDGEEDLLPEALQVPDNEPV